MRTPGHDFDLVRGFLYSENIIDSLTDVAAIVYCESDSPESEHNIVNVNLHDPEKVDGARWQRNFYASSSCGVCGKASLESVKCTVSGPLANIRVQVSVLYRLESELRQAQELFATTGGLHAAGLFDLEGNLLVLREDVGRHNAVDKVIGATLESPEIQIRNCVLIVSGRCSFEVVQKAARAGIPILAGVSAPTSLAVDLATESGMTLVGFLRGPRCNVYAGAERVISQSPIVGNQ
jgi:FdhD protein